MGNKGLKMFLDFKRSSLVNKNCIKIGIAYIASSTFIN